MLGDIGDNYADSIKLWGGQNDGGFKPTLPLTSDHGIITAVLILPNEILLLHSSQVT